MLLVLVVVVVDRVFLLVTQGVAHPFSNLSDPRTRSRCGVQRAIGTSWRRHDNPAKQCQSPEQQLGMRSDTGEHRVRHSVSRKSALEFIQRGFQLRGNTSFPRRDNDCIVLSQPIA